MKRKAKFSIRIFDENHLVDRGGFSFTWLKFISIAASIAIIFILIGMGIVWFTPLKNRLPGYMPISQRAATEEAFLKLDSLTAIQRANQAYFDNLAKILDTDRNPDAIIIDTVSGARPLELDSLILPSDVEQEFIRKMEEAGYFISFSDDKNHDDNGE